MIQFLDSCSDAFWRHLLATFHGFDMCEMGENTKSGSYLQKPLETFVYAIYIERRNPFCVYYLVVYLNMACR
jgi:hypothetical protein